MLGLGLSLFQVAVRGGGRVQAAAIVISKNNQDENTAIGTTIGNVSVIGGTGTYTFTKTADPDSAFSFASPPALKNAIVFDYETATGHNVTIHADNGAGSVLNRTFNIGVNDIDEVPPVITVSTSQTVAENAAFSLTLTADKPVTWTKTGGADQALFTLTAGVLSLPAKDFETPTDANADNAYVVQVTATSTAFAVATNATITVTVTDVAGPTMTSSATFSVAENSAFSTTLTASESATFAKVGGSDTALFTLSGSTLSMTAKDFDTPTDSDTNNTYVVQVRPTSVATGEVGTTQTITVTVTDVVGPTITSSATQTVAENSAFSMTLTASESSTFAKTGGADTALFTLSGATLSLPAQNFEAPADADANNSYLVQVKATSVATGEVGAAFNITVTVTDVAEVGTNRLLLFNGTNYLLLANATDKLLLAGGALLGADLVDGSGNTLVDGSSNTLTAN